MWREETKVLRPGDTGVLMLIMGLSKAGKTYAAGTLLQELDPSNVLWLSAGEGSGWTTVCTALDVDPVGLDLGTVIGEDKRAADRITEFFAGVRRDPPRALILDSIDGLCALIDRSLCAADSKRRDYATGIALLDKRGYGLKLAFLTDLVRRQLDPLSRLGCHVLVTCGLRPVTTAEDQSGATVIHAPAISGQGALELPRVFQEVCEVRRGDGPRRVCVFDDKRPDSVLGSRMGFPASIRSDELGRLVMTRRAAPPELATHDQVEEIRAAGIDPDMLSRILRKDGVDAIDELPKHRAAACVEWLRKGR